MRGCFREHWTHGESPSPGASRRPSPRARGEVEKSRTDSTCHYGYISAVLGRGAQTELSCPGISFPEGYVRRLLFLNGIKAFEAAARTGSFAAAGAELSPLMDERVTEFAGDGICAGAPGHHRRQRQRR